jgi:RNA polymerase sigma factor (sigma-70 family)
MPPDIEGSVADAQGSITRWIGNLKAGGDAAAQPLWERYFDRLVRLARNKLRNRPGRAAVEDEEDAALGAFNSLFRGVPAGRFPQLADRDDLWRLLVVLTIRKVLDQLRRELAAKRGGGQAVAEAEAALDQLVGTEPTPEFAALMAEQYQRLCQALEALEDGSLRPILDLRLEGYDRAEIAARLGCAERTVTRKLKMIRRTFEGLERES